MQTSAQVLMSTQAISIDDDTDTLQRSTLGMLYSLFDNVAPLDIEAMWWLAKNGRIKLSERTTSILLPPVAYPVIF